MIDYKRIPDYTMDAIRRYLDHHLQPGGFLLAVLSNDLREAVGRADENNQQALPDIVSWLYNEAPSTCWGTPERVEQWLEARRTA